MTQRVAIKAKKTKSASDKSVGKIRQNCRSESDNPVGGFRQGCRRILSVMQALRGLFPQKTALQLQLRTDVNLRTAERWLAGQTEISAAAFIDLLHSDVGQPLLLAAMEGCSEKWWQAFRRHIEMSDLLLQQQAHRQRLEKLQQEIIQ